MAGRGARAASLRRRVTDHPFFIVGNDRSGTTMLRMILDRGPDAAIPPESMFLTDLADEWADPGLADPGRARALLAAVWEHPKVRLWDLPAQPPPIPPGLDRDALAAFIAGAPFRAYAARFGKARWGDKTPHYVHHVDELLAIWPQARFVVLVRDGRDVALSLRRMPFGPNNAWAAAQWWARGIRAGQRAQADHPDRVMTVRYEDLAEYPLAHVPGICAFLGLQWDRDMLALEKADRSRIVADQASWFPTLFDGVNTTAVRRWEREMRPRDQAVFAGLAGDELLAFGYPVGAAVHVSPRRARWYDRENQVRRQLNFVKLRVVQERGRELRPALERRLRERREHAAQPPAR